MDIWTGTLWIPIKQKTSKLDPVEDEAKVVQLIFNIFLNGLNGKDYSYTAIASHLTNLQIPTPSGKNVGINTQSKQFSKMKFI